MKRAIWIYIPLLLAEICSAWRIPAAVQNLLLLKSSRRSNVPQFVLDTNHPWLEDNERRLSRYPEVQSELCSKDSALWQTCGTTSKSIPCDLFHTLFVDNNKSGFSRKGRDSLGWTNAIDRINEMSVCDAALEDIRHLHVDIYPHDQENSTPPPELPGLFADVLSRMSNLTRLDWGISGWATSDFESAFVERNLTLLSVTHLQPGCWSDYLVSRCPKLEILEAGDYFDHWSWNTWPRAKEEDPWVQLLRASTGVPIKDLRMAAGHNGWSLELLEELWKASPNITNLTMKGSLDIYGISRQWARSQYGDKEGRVLREILAILSRFTKLKELHLPYSAELDLGFDGGPWCGNAYDGPDGRAYGRQIVQEGAETTEVAAGIIMEALPNVNFSIGDSSPNITYNKMGKPVLSWPWTGRMEQYTLESFAL
ncbi:hypothetical protein GQ53DRAFT_818082 [Thozetella sp. PMI_491]|nr:hypothetical protein GQ53DRAFT_818082 [Thozetella sp. PMI_491]